MIHQVFYFLLHIDDYMIHWFMLYGEWVYVLLFLIIFCETGLVIFPFLPGDSLLFLAGTLATIQHNRLPISLLFFLFAIAAILGNQLNYMMGWMIGTRYLSERPTRYSKQGEGVKRKYWAKAHQFYKDYGAFAIILARFLPIIRTFVPFIAGISDMNQRKFILYNVISGVIWTNSLLTAGYFLGQISFVKQNLIFFIYLFILISLSLPLFSLIYQKFANSSS